MLTFLYLSGSNKSQSGQTWQIINESSLVTDSGKIFPKAWWRLRTQKKVLLFAKLNANAFFFLLRCFSCRTTLGRWKTGTQSWKSYVYEFFSRRGKKQRMDEKTEEWMSNEHEWEQKHLKTKYLIWWFKTVTQLKGINCLRNADERLKG